MLWPFYTSSIDSCEVVPGDGGLMNRSPFSMLNHLTNPYTLLMKIFWVSSPGASGCCFGAPFPQRLPATWALGQAHFPKVGGVSVWLGRDPAVKIASPASLMKPTCLSFL